ncbi:hypothetical protein [Rheinheimera soli]|uniref:Uncharacterized protein n=1 Tax=Rheinheimera soli TaxID=443616 RepID=A0ABU1VVP7_9GAMM|nr:hypothetical protein [Rheinheimera soli]MDR7119772.1 hypothetical protein [Rheinheimera soli]
MYTYLVGGNIHSNCTTDYMVALGLSPENIEAILRQRDFDYCAAKESVKNECTKRIESKWNAVGQLNAALGIYGQSEKTNCVQWVSDHIDACNALLSRGDLLDINFRSNDYWPINN